MNSKNFIQLFYLIAAVALIVLAISLILDTRDLLNTYAPLDRP